MIYGRVGNNIKNLRRRKKMSQEELARKCHCSSKTIGAIEKGTRHCNLVMLDDIAKALDCGFMDLLENSEVRYSRGE